MTAETHQISLDDQGRFVLPRKYREEMSDCRVAIMKSGQQCIAVMPHTEYQAGLQRLRKQVSAEGAALRAYLRNLTTTSIVVEIDKRGRISLPRAFREYANICAAGQIRDQGHFFEIWALEAFADKKSNTST